MKWLLIVVELLGNRGPIYHATYGSALFDTRAECEAQVDSMRSTFKSEKLWTPELIFCFGIIPDDTSVAIVGADKPPGLKLPPIEVPPLSDRYHVMPPPPAGRKP
jgi:hypothetical protein